MQENNLSAILFWIVGIITSLAVGSGMINKTLAIPLIPSGVTILSGWIVVVGTILSVILALFKK